MKPYKLISTIAIMVYLFCGISIASADNLVWQTSKNTAVSIAKSEGKYILLLAGREICSHCQYMRYTACESISPPIKDLIEHSFVPWFCDVDNSTEWHVYASDLGSFYLPLICVINPNDQDNYLDRTTGIQNLQTFYDRLLQYPALDSDDNQPRTTVAGTVTYNETPVTAMVLANGKYMFTGGGEGRFDLTDVPYDANEEITVYAFCSGFAPYKTILTEGAYNLEIEILRDQGGKQLIVTIDGISESSVKPGWYDISGTIENESGTALIAMVLANGQHMFTKNPVGAFHLTVPLDSNDKITFYGFCSGFSPYKIIGGIDVLSQL